MAFFSKLSHAYDIIFDHGVGPPGNGKDLVVGINASDNGCLSMLMKILQPQNAATNKSYIVIHI